MTDILLVCAAGLTLAWLVAAQRRLVARVARRFVALPRVEQVALLLAVGVMTVCAQKQRTENSEQLTDVVAEVFGSVPAYPPAKQPEGAARRGAFNAEMREKGRRGEEEVAVERRSGVSPLQDKDETSSSRSGETPLLRSSVASSANPCQSVQSVASSQSVKSVASQAESECLSNHNSIIRTFDYSIIDSISAQIEFFANGDFITRSNNVECVYRRVNPDDWDDDGIVNEEDEEPMVAADETKFGPQQTLPDGANSNAYCWVDLVVPRTNATFVFNAEISEFGRRGV